MSANPLECGHCKTTLPPTALNTAAPVPCPACGTVVRVLTFPALLRTEMTGAKAQAITLDEESSCFYHPSKKAVIPCDSCGRFLCSLCDVDMGTSHVCPSCLESGKTKGKLDSLTHERYQYDTIALDLALLPLLLIFICLPITIATAPLAIYFSIRHWRTPLSIVPRSRWRFGFAVFFAVVQILAAGGIVAGYVSALF